MGAGYIAIELAGIFQTLGAETTLIIRHEEFLRTFDPVIRQGIYQEYERIGIKIIQSSQVIRVEKGMNGLELTLTNSKSENLVMDSFEHLIWAVGRQANTEPLNLGATQVQSLPDGFIRVDEWQNTAANGVYALGDVCGVEMLTPVAIAAGRRLADRIFGGKMGKLDYENIPSVIFSHPTAGSCGLTEQAAVEKYGAGNIKCYTSQFVNMHYSMTAHKPKTHYKLVSLLPSERIVGIHLFGKGSDEILQGFAVAMKMGATKQDFDNTVAIHPTAAEELVTMR